MHQPDKDRFHVIRSEDVQWKPFAAFPAAQGIQSSRAGFLMIRMTAITRGR
jgi:hypothetical protein